MNSEDILKFSSWAQQTLGLEHITYTGRISGGNSNVTSLISHAAGQLILRHPPANTISEKAARGISREFTLMQALHDVAKVPKPIFFYEESDLIGTPFILVDYVPGVSITNTLPPDYEETPATISKIGEELIDALAAIHKADTRRLPDNFGRPEKFIEREIERWTAIRARHKCRDLPHLDELAEKLASQVPPTETPTIIHCDFHLDNTLFDKTKPELRAIIDWEMATLGDPRIDLGLFLMFWNRNPERRLGFSFVQQISNRANIVTRQDLARRWERQTGRSADHLDYFCAFAFWRLAAIVEGAYVLYTQDQVDSTYAQNLEHDVPALLREAWEIISS
jgi:aminoglycoside phosphotransferase (APT) family kinase protein